MGLSNAHAIELLHREIVACRQCEAAGYPVIPPPMTGGSGGAWFMVIGQAPSLTDQRTGRMYHGPAGLKLRSWLLAAGFTEADFDRDVYFTALTKCFPGRLPGKSTDRAPSLHERALCRRWLDRQLAIVSPKVIILFGKMAVDTFLRPIAPLEQRVGGRFLADGRVYLPFPHSSGASTWLNHSGNRELLAEAIALLASERDAVTTSIGV